MAARATAGDAGGTESKVWQAFAERGVVLHRGLIPRCAWSPARDLVERKLTEAGIWQKGVWLGSDEHPRTTWSRRLKTCSKSTQFKGLLTEEVSAAARALLGPGALCAANPRTQLLFTPPSSQPWMVPHNVWHLDVPRLGDSAAPGVQMFTFLAPVAPGGGGTLLVAGSHHLLNDQGFIGSKGVKNRLRGEPYFRRLMDRHAPHRERLLGELGAVDGVPVEVVELHGDPGDVYFVDMRLLHTLAPNASASPRLMVTHRFMLEVQRRAVDAAYAKLGERRRLTRRGPRPAKATPEPMSVSTAL